MFRYLKQFTFLNVSDIKTKRTPLNILYSVLKIWSTRCFKLHQLLISESKILEFLKAEIPLIPIIDWYFNRKVKRQILLPSTVPQEGVEKSMAKHFSWFAILSIHQHQCLEILYVLNGLNPLITYLLNNPYYLPS